MPGQQTVVFRRLPQGMLTTLSSQFEVFTFYQILNSLG